MKQERWQELGYASFREWRLADQKARDATKAAAKASVLTPGGPGTGGAQLAPRTQSYTRYCSAAPPAPPAWPTYAERLACVDAPSAALDRVLHMDGAELLAFLAELNAPCEQIETLLMRVAVRQNRRLLNLLREREQKRAAAEHQLLKAKQSRQLKRERDAGYRKQRCIQPRSSALRSVKWYD